VPGVPQQLRMGRRKRMRKIRGDLKGKKGVGKGDQNSTLRDATNRFGIGLSGVEGGKKKSLSRRLSAARKRRSTEPVSEVTKGARGQSRGNSFDAWGGGEKITGDEPLLVGSKLLFKGLEISI